MGLIIPTIFLAISLIIGFYLKKLNEELKVLLLLFFGIILSVVTNYLGIVINESFFLFSGLIVFSLLVFEYIPKLNLKHLDFEKKFSLNFTASILASSLIAGYLTYLLTNESFFGILIFSIAMFVSELSYEKKSTKLTHIIGLESNISIATVLIILFSIFEIKRLFDLNLGGFYFVLAEKIALSAGLGLIGALIFLRFAEDKKHYKALTVFALIVLFLIGERIALASITILISAIFFNDFGTRKTQHTFDFFKKLRSIFEVLVLILAGFLFRESFTPELIMISLTIFTIFFFLRFFAINFFALPTTQKLFLTMNNPKGSVGSLIYIFVIILYPSLTYLWNIFFIQIILTEMISYMAHRLHHPNNF